MDIPLLQPELIWMLIGERMANGYAMYIHIIDDTGPLSAGVYWLIHLIAGKSLVTYHIIAAALIFFQIIYINLLFIRCKAFEENTYLPAFVMVVLFHLSFDFLTLSPALMGTTFVILALGQLFLQTVRHHDQPESIFLMGLFGGIAFCFHFPLIVFLPFLLVAGLIINGHNALQFSLCIAGYFMPLAICSLYYLWIDGLKEFIWGFIFSIRIIDVYQHVSFFDLLSLFAPALIFTFVGFVIGFIVKRLAVNQQKQNHLIILYLVFSATTIFVANRTTPYQLVVLLPGMVYYISQIFIYINRKKLKAALFYFFFIGIPAIGYYWLYEKTAGEEANNYIVNSGQQYDFTRNSKVVVLGNDLAYYKNSSLAGPYLNYQLSKSILEQFHSYPSLTKIYLSFTEDPPKFIIDEEGVFARLSEQLPAIKEKYLLERKGIYQLKKPQSVIQKQ